MLELRCVSDQSGEICDVNFTFEKAKIYVFDDNLYTVTLFALLSGLEPLASGQILLDRQDITDFPLERQAQAGILLADDRAPVMPGVTVLDYLEAAARNVLTKSEREAALMPVGLEYSDEQQLLDETLPASKRARVELAAMLAAGKKVYLLDELPLDEPQLRVRVACALQERGACVLSANGDATWPEQVYRLRWQDHRPIIKNFYVANK